MSAAGEATTSAISVNGARIEPIDRGHGRPVLFLHPHIGLDAAAGVLAMLAEGRRLIAPSIRASAIPSGRPGSRRSMISPICIST
jgi:hypothetical protein